VFSIKLKLMKNMDKLEINGEYKECMSQFSDCSYGFESKNFYANKVENTDMLNKLLESSKDNKMMNQILLPEQPGNSEKSELQFLQKKRSLEEDVASLNIRKHVKGQENAKYNTGRWEEDEHKKFLKAICLYGNEWKRVQNYIGTRSSTQARSHAQKFFLRIKKSIKLNGNKIEEELKNQSKIDEICGGLEGGTLNL
jgi:SHAQKYF class myb-like DNA-binding protein